MKSSKPLKHRINFSKLSVWAFALAIIILGGLFFTNDFGLVDIHKTSIITAVGIDIQDEEVAVTAEIAVPQPSQSGENIKYTRIQGSGRTIADAMNEINAKSGFYPKLQFCQLILVGENCQDYELFRVLGCFYRKNYSELTALVAMCKGKAGDMLAQKSDVSDMTSEAIRKVLSDEIEKSANGNSVNLKDIAMSEYSKSGSCYMPFVETNKPGTSQNGMNGDGIGGESSGGSGQGGESSGGQGGSGGEGGQGGQGQSGGQSGQSGQGGESVEFTAKRTAIFSGGRFKTILDERQSFALSLLKNDIRLAVLPFDSDGVHYTLGLKNTDGGAGLKFKDGAPEATLSFKANAQIQGMRVVVQPDKTISDDVIPESVLQDAKAEIQSRMSELVDICRQNDCDILELREQLYKYHHKHYDTFAENLTSLVNIRYEIDIQSEN